MRTLAIIPVKKVSKRLDNKNFLHVGDKPMFQLAIHLALQARSLGVVDEVVLSYDDPHELLDAQNSVRLHRRPNALRNDINHTTLQVVQDVLAPSESWGCVNGCASMIHNNPWDLICLLVPSSPLRTLNHIISSRLLLHREDDVAVMSVTTYRQDPRGAVVQGQQGCLRKIWPSDVIDDGTALYKHCGTVIWAKSAWVLGAKSWYDSDRIRPFFVKPDEAIDVNDALDLVTARRMAVQG
ncbi:MAG: hypothetical protein HY976_03985 [Candidatus Kerfeldbacteria bacterium]|nr:hypothetical protein [Candidatus Kerfeldbacteria bacterium]